MSKYRVKLPQPSVTLAAVALACLTTCLTSAARADDVLYRTGPGGTLTAVGPSRAADDIQLAAAAGSLTAITAFRGVQVGSHFDSSLSEWRLTIDLYDSGGPWVAGVSPSTLVGSATWEFHNTPIGGGQVRRDFDVSGLGWQVTGGDCTMVLSLTDLTGVPMQLGAFGVESFPSVGSTDPVIWFDDNLDGAVDADELISTSRALTATIEGVNLDTWPNLVITSDTTLSSAPNPYEGAALTVRGCTVTMDGPHSFDSLTIQRNTAGIAGQVTHSPGTATGLQLTIAHDLIVQGNVGGVTSFINANRCGYGMNQGPGAGQYVRFVTHAGGGGHGGRGGDSGVPVGLGGAAYDSATAPVMAGSGGGSDVATPGNVGAQGGGIIRIIAGGNVVVDGGILASGGDGVGSDTGGAGGGSIWITAASISGVGSIQANGGQSCCSYSGGGGGGRIRLESCSPVSVAGISVNGRQGGPAAENGTISTQIIGGATIGTQPSNALACAIGTAGFTMTATGAGALGYGWQWQAVVGGPWLGVTEGINADPQTGLAAFTASGSQTSALTLGAFALRGVHFRDFRGVVSGACASTTSSAARLTVCVADADCNGLIQPADIAIAVSGWVQSLGGGLLGDYDHDGQIAPADIGVFVSDWFAAVQQGGC